MFALVFAAAFSHAAVAVAQGQGAAMPPAANFGSPPTGQIPILFNDHHVYAKPNTLKQGRVLAALVRGGTVLIPLRSMFEQMGATVSYDAASKTVDVSKAGSDVKVTVGQPEVVINGESRPLDVPPIMYQGHVLVPVRVISEGMGAYVQWVPDKQTVVVRYIVSTPPPSPTPAPTPTEAAPLPTPTPAPASTPFLKVYAAGDYLSPKVYNQFSSGQNTNNQDGFSYAIHGNAQFSLWNIPFIVGGSFDQDNYAHTCGLDASGAYTAHCYVTNIGNTGSTAVPSFTARNYLGAAHV
ncbi:MAG: copper amine oxidase N-terminal domain-containing protein, partial [Candidatus Aquilonibacter sp.]